MDWILLLLGASTLLQAILVFLVARKLARIERAIKQLKRLHSGRAHPEPTVDPVRPADRTRSAPQLQPPLGNVQAAPAIPALPPVPTAVRFPPPDFYGKPDEDCISALGAQAKPVTDVGDAALRFSEGQLPQDELRRCLERSGRRFGVADFANADDGHRLQLLENPDVTELQKNPLLIETEPGVFEMYPSPSIVTAPVAFQQYFKAGQPRKAARLRGDPRGTFDLIDHGTW